MGGWMVEDRGPPSGSWAGGRRIPTAHHVVQFASDLPSVFGTEGCDGVTCPRSLIKGELPVPQMQAASQLFL